MILANHHKGRDGSITRTILMSSALLALVGSPVGLSAAESETFTGTAAASGTFKRPLLLVDGQRYELKASDKADASVAELLERQGIAGYDLDLSAPASTAGDLHDA
jgi:hypothetical protein